PTHWKQSVMYLGDAVSVQQGSQIEGTITLSPNSKNPRFLDVELMFSVMRASDYKQIQIKRWHVVNEM
ncbi:protein arginine N-methyltransferase 1, partial [Apostichopus japonicus]